MMDKIIFENFDLQSFNTFKVKAIAKYLAHIKSEQEIYEILDDKRTHQAERLILGGGSNVLFTRDFDGLILKNDIQGIEVIEENEEKVILKIGGGVNWHQLVLYAIENNWAGLENLSLIPGTVGAAPVQNIGAYGVEFDSVFEKLEAIELDEKKLLQFNAKECQFSYRDSLFKKTLKNKVIITRVYIRLSKRPEFNISYGMVQETLEKMNVRELSIKAISDAIVAIRSQKLPDPNQLPNAGSFFKNPIITQLHFQKLKKTHPEIPSYFINEEKVKVPAAWLIEQCGWKGKQIGKVGVHQNQALVLVNYGELNGQYIDQLAEKIRKDVYGTFGVSLEKEVNIL